MTVEIDGDRNCEPGGEVTGVVRWRLDRPPSKGVLRLMWLTKGKAVQSDQHVIETLELHRLEAVPQGADGPYRDAPADEVPLADVDARRFRIAVPTSPYSYLGRLVTVAWAVEVTLEPSGFRKRAEFISAPGGAPCTHVHQRRLDT